MKNTGIKVFLLALLITAAGALFSVTALADISVIASGNCGDQGDNVTWVLTSDGTLTVSGYGKMADYTLRSSAPWGSNRNNIKSLVLSGNITRIGDYTFYYLPNCAGTLSIPNNVVEIGDYAFAETGFTGTLTLPGSTVEIEAYAFAYCNFTGELIIPNSVKTIGERAFYDNWNTSPFEIVVFGTGVESLGDQAFYSGHYNSYAVILEGNAPTIGTNVFNEDTLLLYRQGATGYDSITTCQIDGVVEDLGSANASLDLSNGSITALRANGCNYYAQNTGTSYTVKQTTSTCLLRQSLSGGQPTSNTVEIRRGTVPLSIVDLNISSLASPVSILENSELTLTIIGESKLTSTSTSDNSASITAGISVPATAKLTIKGAGTLTSTGGYYGAGIGSSRYKNCGTVEISNGTINAYGGQDGAGIGGGDSGDGGTIAISGGTVYAEGRSSGAGIGGGWQGNGGIIAISGGEVTAVGNDNGAGIGGGGSGDGGKIDITGGTVIATSSGYYGAGIGGGSYSNGGTVTLKSCKVTAEGYYHAIGGGNLNNQYGCTEISIASDVEITATYSDCDGSQYQELITYGTVLDSAALTGNGALFQVDAFGASGVGYQWQESADNSSWADVDGQVGPEARIPVSDDNNGYYYRCKITNGFGNTVYTDPKQAYVLAFTKHPTDLSVELTDMAALSVTSSCTNVTYQWERSYDQGENWTDVAGEIYSTLIVNSTLSENNAIYRCVITASNGDTLASDSAKITVASDAITYTTQYYLQKPEGSGYALVDQVVTEAAAGDAVTAPAKSYEHFTENTAMGLKSGTVLADSSLTLARYYDRMSYTMSFDVNGGSDEAHIQALYGAEITAPKNPTKLGCVFSGWYSDPELTMPYEITTMPGGDITIYAKWTVVGQGRGLEYEIAGIKLRNGSFEIIDQIPTGTFYAEVSVKNLSSETTDVLVLSLYDSRGKFLGMEYLYANPPIGYTFTLGAGINNNGGSIAQIQATMLPILGGLVPLAESVQYTAGR